MRNKYSKQFEKEMEALAPQKTIRELLEVARCTYNYEITLDQLRKYLSKRQIRYKDYFPSKVRQMGLNKPIYSEFKKPDGMTLVKIASNKWEYKQRYIWTKYYNEELTDNDYIIFLDQDRTNFNIDNLKKITRRESSILSNQKIFSQDPEGTKAGILTAKLIIQVKEMRNKK